MKKDPVYNGPPLGAPGKPVATTFTVMATTNPEALAALARAVNYRLSKVGATADFQEQGPIPYPEEPWWIGGKETWIQWSDPLRRRYWMRPGSTGKPVWIPSKGLLGHLLRAAQFKGWAGYVGDRGTFQEIALRCFEWSEPRPSRQSFETFSEHDRDLARPALRDMRLSAAELDSFATQDLPRLAVNT